MPNYRNKSKIVKREELIPPGKLEEGMIITFRYNSGSDKTPVVLVIYYDRKKKMMRSMRMRRSMRIRRESMTRIEEMIEKKKMAQHQRRHCCYCSILGSLA